jgi:hypothetical protein
MNIYEKLGKARIKLQELNLKKSGKNKFARFSYYELADFIPAVNKIFEELKLYSMFSLEPEQARLTIVNAEKPDEEILFTSPTATVDLKGCTAIQAIGAIHTYMKRYLYMNALEIVEHDALDATVGAAINYDKSIENINDINQLNKTYRLLMESAHSDSSWKKRLMDKCEALHAKYNRESNMFEAAA